MVANTRFADGLVSVGTNESSLSALGQEGRVESGSSNQLPNNLIVCVGTLRTKSYSFNVCHWQLEAYCGSCIISKRASSSV
jgi:hypothetical protein